MKKPLRKTIFITFLNLAVIFVFSCGSESKRPKNIIFFISDGCGFNHVAAASSYEFGRVGAQAYAQFPVRLAMSTYLADQPPYDPDQAWSDFDYIKHRPTDSAAAGTALATGVKTCYCRLGTDCDGTPVTNVVEQAEKSGRATGVATSVEFDNATPAVFVAHNENRNDYQKIAQDMLQVSAVDVIMGCGHPFYDGAGGPASDTNYTDVGGAALWSALIAGELGGDADGDGRADPWTLIQDRAEFQKLMSGPAPRRVLGLVKSRGTLQQLRSGDPLADPFVVPLNTAMPTLAEMSLAAINVLDADEDGFFLMIEGGAVDWAAHKNQTGRTLEEQIDFDRAVAAVVEWVEANSSWDETLVLVTADHETGYITGPGSNPADRVSDMPVEKIWTPLVNNGPGRVPGLEWHSGSHTNALVPFYAKGAGSAAFADCATRTDPVRGPFLDNADVGRVLMSLCAAR